MFMRIMNNLFCDKDGIVSTTDSLVIVGIVLFLVVSICLVYYGIEWKHYDTFAQMTVGGGSALKISKTAKDVAKYLKERGEEE